uniref:Uncharacterized protein n=1 Tax=Steinernema glaseri TaxID=37863 RepID=A0A1I7Z0C1_9BILA
MSSPHRHNHHPIKLFNPEPKQINRLRLRPPLPRNTLIYRLGAISAAQCPQLPSTLGRSPSPLPYAVAYKARCAIDHPRRRILPFAITLPRSPTSPFAA